MCRYFPVKEILVFSATLNRKPQCQWWVGYHFVTPWMEKFKETTCHELWCYFNSCRNSILVQKRGFSITHQLTTSLIRWIHTKFFFTHSLVCCNFLNLLDATLHYKFLTSQWYLISQFSFILLFWNIISCP